MLALTITINNRISYLTECNCHLHVVRRLQRPGCRTAFLTEVLTGPLERAEMKATGRDGTKNDNLSEVGIPALRALGESRVHQSGASGSALQ